MRMSGVVVGSVFGDLWDLGSTPRSPHNSLLFFQIHSCADFQVVSTMCSHRSARHVSIGADPKAQKARTPCAWSTVLHSIPRVNVAEDSNGPQMPFTPPSGPVPPWFLHFFFFSFLFYLLIIFINCYYLINS